MSKLLRSFWLRFFKFDWKFGFVLIILFGVPRFMLVLTANLTGNYSLVSIIFLMMWIAPFILLTKSGRKGIGMQKPQHYLWLLYAFAIGVFVCSTIYFLGIWLFDHSISNWFVYISKSYQLPAGVISPADKRIYFIIFALIGMTFSPIGEELLYRGLIHKSFALQFGEQRASIIDSLAFGVTHLAHFGIVYTIGGWKFLPIPAILWMFFMFLTGLVFSFCKTKTGSILGAIICHAGFNLAMTYFIFYHLL